MRDVTSEMCPMRISILCSGTSALSLSHVVLTLFVHYVYRSSSGTEVALLG
jgi:hypothetical protein